MDSGVDARANRLIINLARAPLISLVDPSVSVTGSAVSFVDEKGAVLSILLTTYVASRIVQYLVFRVSSIAGSWDSRAFSDR